MTFSIVVGFRVVGDQKLTGCVEGRARYDAPGEAPVQRAKDEQSSQTDATDQAARVKQELGQSPNLGAARC